MVRRRVGGPADANGAVGRASAWAAHGDARGILIWKKIAADPHVTAGQVRNGGEIAEERRRDAAGDEPRWMASPWVRRVARGIFLGG